jgi:DNA excision repair protein ERCC-4
MSNEDRDGESATAWTDPAVMPPRRHQLRVDLSERNAAVLRLARECEDFDVQMVQLPIGDYFIDSGVVVERKTYADFAISLVDGRLFPQAAALAQSPHRPVVLLEGPKPLRMPDVHPHALKGAIVSLAVMWRLPVLHARDPEDALRILRLLAQQVGDSEQRVLRRYDRKPKRIASRRLYMLQGLSGVGPALAQRLLIKFGSVERVVTADEASLTQVSGIGSRKAARIRELVAG